MRNLWSFPTRSLPRRLVCAPGELSLDSGAGRQKEHNMVGATHQSKRSYWRVSRILRMDRQRPGSAEPTGGEEDIP